MTDLQMGMLYSLTYRALQMLVGLAFSYMGYKLLMQRGRASKKATTEPVNTVEVSLRKVILSGAQPGTLFAAFGMILVGLSVTKPAYLESTKIYYPPDRADTQPRSQGDEVNHRANRQPDHLGKESGDERIKSPTKDGSDTGAARR